jgi:hypothetical protein
VIVVLLLVHSAVDYPLRTTAVMCTFAFACALMVEPPSPSRTRRGGGEAATRSRPRAIPLPNDQPA